MKTEITVREMAAIKRIAQNSNANVVKKNKLKAKIAELTKEYTELSDAIEADEAGIIKRFGHTSEELVEKVVLTTDKLDKDGNPVKVTKYIPRENILKYNEEKKYYEVIEAEPQGMSIDFDDNVEVLDESSEENVPSNDNSAFETL